MIKLASETIPKEHLDSLADWIKTYPKLTKGNLTLELEEKFAKKVGAKYSVFVNSGSSANLLMVAALKYGPFINSNCSKNIVVPALSWATDIAPIIQLGFNPVLVDTDASYGFTIDMSQLEFLFKKYNPFAFLYVSILGFNTGIKEVKELCDKYGVLLLEDNCESLMTEDAGKYGLMSSYSTYYGHHISTIEGGFITTNNKSYYEHLLMLRSHGWSRDCSLEYKKLLKEINNVSDFNDNYTFYVPGFNVRNNEIGAYLGLLQLDVLDKYCSIRNRNWNLWQELLSCETTMHWEDKFISNFALPLLRLQDRNEVIQVCKENEIECRPLVAGSMSLQPMFKDYCGEIYHTPMADECHQTGMYLPNHADVSEDDVKFMAKVVLEVL